MAGGELMTLSSREIRFFTYGEYVRTLAVKRAYKWNTRTDRDERASENARRIDNRSRLMRIVHNR